MEEADYSPQAIEYLEQILSRGIFEDSGVDVRMYGVKIIQDVLTWFPTDWNLANSLRKINVVGKFDYYYRHQSFLKFNNYWYKNGEPRIGHIFLFGLEFHFL